MERGDGASLSWGRATSPGLWPAAPLPPAVAALASSPSPSSSPPHSCCSAPSPNSRAAPGSAPLAGSSGRRRGVWEEDAPLVSVCVVPPCSTVSISPLDISAAWGYDTDGPTCDHEGGRGGGRGGGGQEIYCTRLLHACMHPVQGYHERRVWEHSIYLPILSIYPVSCML